MPRSSPGSRRSARGGNGGGDERGAPRPRTRRAVPSRLAIAAHGGAGGGGRRDCPGRSVGCGPAPRAGIWADHRSAEAMLAPRVGGTRMLPPEPRRGSEASGRLGSLLVHRRYDGREARRDYGRNSSSRFAQPRCGGGSSGEAAGCPGRMRDRGGRSRPVRPAAGTGRSRCRRVRRRRGPHDASRSGRAGKCRRGGGAGGRPRRETAGRCGRSPGRIETEARSSLGTARDGAGRLERVVAGCAAAIRRRARRSRPRACRRPGTVPDGRSGARSARRARGRSCGVVQQEPRRGRPRAGAGGPASAAKVQRTFSRWSLWSTTWIRTRLFRGDAGGEPGGSTRNRSGRLARSRPRDRERRGRRRRA